MNTKSFKTFIGMGAISLAVVLIILTVTCFAVLTYVSADSEYKLSEKSSASVSDYYHADALANETLREISSAIKNGKLQDFASQKGYNVTRITGHDVVSFQIPVRKGKKLQIEVSFSAPEQWEILKWEITTNSQLGRD